MPPTEPECTGHDDLAGEFRQLGGTALDQLEVWLDRVRERAAAGTETSAATSTEAGAAPDAAPIPASCAVCPVCAVIALIRGERAELAVRLAEHAGGLLTVLRTALAEGNGAPSAAEPAGHAGAADQGPAGRRAVQHIAVVRSDRPPPGC